MTEVFGLSLELVMLATWLAIGLSIHMSRNNTRHIWSVVQNTNGIIEVLKKESDIEWEERN